MPDERMARTMTAISEIFGNLIRADGEQPKWFISFGSLLWFVRDRMLGRPFDTDIDVSVFWGELKREDIINKFQEYGYTLKKEVLDNWHRKPLQMVFTATAPGMMPCDIDLFFWVLGEKYAWHTYDMFNRNQPIMDEYTFKGTPKEFIMAPTVSVVWEEIAPNVQIPLKYGSLLDTWYPPMTDADGKYVANSLWIIPNRQYGQSKSHKMVTLKSCKNMQGDLG